MVVLPVERIFKQKNGTAGGADDRFLDAGLAARVDHVLGDGKTFVQAPFGKLGGWARATSGPFNIAQPWDQELLDRLGRPEAEQAAREAPAKDTSNNNRYGLSFRLGLTV
jgi:hypothetical protein